MITITGTLDVDAEYRVGLDREAKVVVTVNVGGQLFEAAVSQGVRPEAHLIAQDKARALKRGTSGTITCASLRWCADHGRARFVCGGTPGVEVGGVAL